MKPSSKSIKFSIATDVHLGHKQNQPIRKNDSFLAFEEVLSIATEEQADFLLLGGDLFDEVNPSQKTIYKCLDILQHYVQGQGKKDLKAKSLQNPEYRINFQNQNMNIKLPIFTIHGNHDYPSNDFGKLSICDLLHVSNYANYFGKHTDLSEIVVRPVIIQKEGVKMKVAIYGLGYIKDTVLNDMFEQKKVKFHQLQNKDEYFCLFIFHQNRYKKGLKAGAPSLKCINAKHIPAWMDLTIWGHEHQAINKIEIEDDRKIFQPGSTVITSFIEAEALPKQCLMVEIFDNGQTDLTPIALEKSYRPMICRNLQIAQLQKKHKKQSREQFDFFIYLDNQLNQIIQQVDKQFPGRKPIIRIKIQHSGYEISRWRILQLKYSQKVANPQSIMTFWKRKQQKTNQKHIMEAFMTKANLEGFDQKQISEQILNIYTKKQQNKNLYYDPRELYKYHQNSVMKDLINAKDYLGTFMSKDIERKAKPMVKQLQMIYKTIPKDVDQPARIQIQRLQAILSLDSNGVRKQDRQSFNEAQSRKVNVNELWEQQRKILTLKEDQILKCNLMQNYGQNFFLEEPKIKPDPNKMQIEQKVEKSSKSKEHSSRLSTTSSNMNNLSSWVSSGLPKPKVQKMQVQCPETQQKPPKRQGILKNPHDLSGHSSSHDHDEDEEDCCKRAQRTAYDEGGVKRNFEGAKKMVKENNDKKFKKEVKKEEIKKNEKNKKNVRWSDSDGEW